jgi:hypothetical protein
MLNILVVTVLFGQLSGTNGLQPELLGVFRSFFLDCQSLGWIYFMFDYLVQIRILSFRLNVVVLLEIECLPFVLRNLKPSVTDIVGLVFRELVLGLLSLASSVCVEDVLLLIAS